MSDWKEKIAENKTRKGFHGLSDKQWEECKNSFPYSEIPHIALTVHKAIEEKWNCEKCKNKGCLVSMHLLNSNNRFCSDFTPKEDT